MGPSGSEVEMMWHQWTDEIPESGGHYIATEKQEIFQQETWQLTKKSRNLEEFLRKYVGPTKDQSQSKCDMMHYCADQS